MAVPAKKAVSKRRTKPASKPKTAEIPDKLYYKIGEAAELVGVKPYVLRFWESEFNALKPSKSGSQHRLYRKRDIETLRQIKELLYGERLTIEGARKRLKEIQKKDPRQGELPLEEKQFRAALIRIRREIQALHRLLSS